MGTGNHDASRVTQRKRAITMYSWNAANNAAITAGKSVRREQSGSQLGELVTYRNITKAYSTPATLGACPCSVEELEFPSGGNISNNVE
jgi:hypothetical protein